MSADDLESSCLPVCFVVCFVCLHNYSSVKPSESPRKNWTAAISMPLIRPLIRIRRPSPDKQPLIQLYPDSAKELYVFLLMGCDQEEAVPAVFQNIADYLQLKGLIKPGKGFIHYKHMGRCKNGPQAVSYTHLQFDYDKNYEHRQKPL